MRPAPAAALAIAVTACVGVALSAQQFRSGVELVRVPVTVSGRDGLLVRGLTAESFEIREDGVRQTISAFAEGAPGEAVPLHLGLMLDASGSMEKDIRDAANGAVQFVTALEEAADVTFVDFDSKIRLGRFEPASYEHLFERIRSPKADGMTALYDAIAAYVRSTASRGGQHVLLLYTDGFDSVSRITYSDLLALLRADNVMLYALGYLESASGTERAAGQMRLTSLARETGGDAFFPATLRDLTKAYARILDELGSRYTLGYVSTNTKADGKYRKIEVRLIAAEHKAAKVRTRPGYIATSR
ncbi:MAG TPA: VWA domain-containing protein [Vicinamibacterales bacterium]|nr:VWA domain-containing protein [Vicinamibacterales bacterium]